LGHLDLLNVIRYMAWMRLYPWVSSWADIMLNPFRVLLFFWVMRYSQGFTLGLHVEPLRGSLDAFIFFDYVYGPQRGPTFEPRVLPGE